MIEEMKVITSQVFNLIEFKDTLTKPFFSKIHSLLPQQDISIWGHQLLLQLKIQMGMFTNAN